MCVDQSFQRWLLIVQEELVILAWWWLEPCVVDGGLVEHTFELVGLQVGFEDAGSMDF
jgi:hypothetical protein